MWLDSNVQLTASMNTMAGCGEEECAGRSLAKMDLVFLTDGANELGCFNAGMKSEDILSDVTISPTMKTARRNTCNSTVRKNVCSLCPESFNFKSGLLYHMRERHNVTGIAQCDLCRLGFKRLSDYRKHILTVHEKYRPFPCSLCDASFYLRKDLTKHTSSVHEKLKPYECDQCGYKFGKKEHRTRHIRSVHDKKVRS